MALSSRLRGDKGITGRLFHTFTGQGLGGLLMQDEVSVPSIGKESHLINAGGTLNAWRGSKGAQESASHNNYQSGIAGPRVDCVGCCLCIHTRC